MERVIALRIMVFRLHLNKTTNNACHTNFYSYKVFWYFLADVNQDLKCLSNQSKRSKDFVVANMRYNAMK